MTTNAPASRYARWWMPTWPALGAFFAAVLLLSLIVQHATRGAAAANWAAFVSNMAMGLLGAVLAGVAFGFVAVAAVSGEAGLRRRSYGAKSLTTFLLTIISGFLVGLSAVGMSIESHSIYGALHDPMDLRILPVLLFMLVAWPMGHLAGFSYGIAALRRRGERSWLGLVGMCCNLLALPVWYVTMLTPSPAAAIF